MHIFQYLNYAGMTNIEKTSDESFKKMCVNRNITSKRLVHFCTLVKFDPVIRLLTLLVRRPSSCSREEYYKRSDEDFLQVDREDVKAFVVSLTMPFSLNFKS